jgi:hypothetical protein
VNVWNGKCNGRGNKGYKMSTVCIMVSWSGARECIVSHKYMFCNKNLNGQVLNKLIPIIVIGKDSIWYNCFKTNFSIMFVVMDTTSRHEDSVTM